jgi:two-component system OmpR family response regulator
MRILIAEDDPTLAGGVQHALRDAGYAVDWVKNGLECDSALHSTQFDLLILDIGLPKKSGLDVLKSLRAKDSQLPVLILTALDGVNDCVRGLDHGADDYIAKPFEIAELAARVRALTRRGMAGSSTLLKHGSLTYDQVGRTASLSGQPVDLSARELGLLEILLRRPGRFVSKNQLVDHLCEWGEEVSANAIEVYVHRLRRKLECGGVRILTVRGLGYTLEKPQPAKTDA